MGRPSLNFVIKKLQEAGFRTGRAFPGTKMPCIQVPAVTLAIHRDEGVSQILAVTVFCPEPMGGVKCEDTACLVSKQLRSLGYDCVQENCRYDGKGDRFSVRILATWTEPEPPAPFTVFIGNLTLKYLTEFTAVQKNQVEVIGACGSSVPVTLHETQKPWVITLEELFPADTQETANPVSPFNLSVRRGGSWEEFQNCCWTEIRRADTATGLHQIRTAVAQSKREVPHG